MAVWGRVLWRRCGVTVLLRQRPALLPVIDQDQDVKVPLIDTCQRMQNLLSSFDPSSLQGVVGTSKAAASSH